MQLISLHAAIKMEKVSRVGRGDSSSHFLNPFTYGSSVRKIGKKQSMKCSLYVSI